MHKRGPKEQRPGVKSLYGYNSVSGRTSLKRKNEVFKNYVYTGVPVERDSESSGRKQPGSFKWEGWIRGSFSTTALLGWLGVCLHTSFDGGLTSF